MPSVSYLKKSFCVIIFLKKNINKLHNKLFSFFFLNAKYSKYDLNLKSKIKIWLIFLNKFDRWFNKFAVFNSTFQDWTETQHS